MRWHAALVVVAFALSLAAVVVTPWCTRDRVVEPARWLQAISSVPALLRPAPLAPDRGGGEGARIVLVHPPWRDDVVRALRASGALPRAAVATTALAPRHGALLPTVVLVSDGSAPLPRALRSLVDPVDAVVAGGIRVARLARGPATTGARSLLDELASARVELRAAGGSDGDIDCPWSASAQRHECTGMPEWLHVGVEELPVGGRTVRCAWAHPKTGKALVIRFEDVRLLGMLALSLALTDGAAANTRGAPVNAVLRIDGVERGHVTQQAGRRGFVVQHVDIADAPNDADLELEITTPDDGQRHACFQLDTAVR